MSNVTVLTPDCPEILADDSILIARFFDVDKARSLIARPGIWFSRYDCMSDSSEGKYHALFKPDAQTMSVESLNKIRAMRQTDYMPLISCWTLFDSGEDRKMWDAYAPYPGSICCITTPRRLRESLVVNNVPCCLVRYIDDEELNKNPGNDGYLIKVPFYQEGGRLEDAVYFSTELVKRAKYSFEKEVRFICFLNHKQQMEEGQPGRLIKFKDCRVVMPFLRIITRPDIPSDVKRMLQSRFGCSVVSSTVCS